MNTILGIDEAGRGPVLGPMILAGVLVPKNQESLLVEWGITDSKKFGSQEKGKRQRAELAEKIRQNFAHQVVPLSPERVDHYVQTKSLNRLEQEVAQQILQDLPADLVILDGANLFKPLTNEKIQALNKADETYLSVSAASILAKTERDRLFGDLVRPFEQDYGPVRGGGYPNAQTLRFVQWYQQNKGVLPPFFRKSYHWKKLEESL